MSGLAVPKTAGLRREARALPPFATPELSPGLALAIWSASAAAVALVVWGAVFGDEHVAAYRVAFRLVGLAFVACGVVAWRRRPDSRSGLLMTATGLLLFVEPVLAQLGAPAFTTAADLFEDLWSITIIWLLLTMLSGGHLTTRGEKLLVGLFVLEFALEVVRIAGGGARHGTLASLEGLAVSLGCLGTAAVVGVRFKRATGPRRRALLPSVAGIAALVLFAAAQNAPPLWLKWLAVLSLLAIPGGFLAGLLSSRLARGGLADLFRHLHTMRGDELQPALARALGDPSAEVVEGRPAAGTGRSLARINDEAALVYDASLDDDPELIEAVTSAAAIALESRARLERLVTAGDSERRRLERNLHDGAQQRLVALAMRLRLIEYQIHSDPSAAQELVAGASQELALSLEELRELARGIHPAVLSHGLEPALQALAAQSAVPTEVDFGAAGELSAPVELAVYFVTSEALANVGKYARAHGASVRVARDGDTLRLEVADDGIGGADAARGTGLRGLADRVEALDGRLQVDSPHGLGTVVRAELPCAS